VADAEIFDLAARRPRSPAAATAEEVVDDLLRMIGQSSDPTEAALCVIAGFARFLATRGVSADYIAHIVAWHMAAQLAAGPT